MDKKPNRGQWPQKCSVASEVSKQLVSHFIRFVDPHPYCVFCHTTIDGSGNNSEVNFKEISLEGARIQ